MAQYKLYCIGASGNSYKVALYLNCAGLDWKPVGVDFAGGETRDANWRAETNTMGEVSSTTTSLPAVRSPTARSAISSRLGFCKQLRCGSDNVASATPNVSS